MSQEQPPMSDSVEESASESNIDMNLYSRQIGAYGVETMGKLVQLRVLIVGLRGIGVEAAKNVILAGPKSVTLLDNEAAKIEDLGTNFYLTKQHVADGTSRAQACLEQLAELNSYVEVTASTQQQIDAAFLRQFSVVVMCNQTMQECVRVNGVCRKEGVLFIASETTGVTGSMFTDFGEQFTVLDADGEQAETKVMQKLVVKDGVATISTDGQHGLEDDGAVKLESVHVLNEDGTVPEGVEELNDKEFPVKVIKYDLFELKATFEKASGVYSGMSTGVKKPKVLDFRSLEETLQQPVAAGKWGLLLTDYGKFGRSEQLHIAKLALWEYEKQNGALPALHDVEAAEKCVALAKEIMAQHKAAEEKQAGSALVLEEVDENVVRQTALYARAELVGFTAFLGGVVAQEIVKATGKYTPVQQWLHTDAFELVPEQVREDAKQPEESRYKWQVAVLGAEAQKGIQNGKYFVVGAGALGCEYLKQLALCGAGTGPDGVVYCTDMDTIEVSNLNRQFLFRPNNVGQPKSTCAAAAAAVMNPDMKSHTWTIAVGPDTEDTFHDEFWASLDCVVNALDNVKARKYVDSKCVFFEKPLLESGTLGTKANTQVVFPHATQSYGETEDPEEKSIPMCTLRNFPHLFVHCAEWARAEFETLFANGPAETNAFLRDQQKYFDQLAREGNAKVQLEKLQVVQEWVDYLQTAKQSDAEALKVAVKMAYKYFHSRFRDMIASLTKAFPEDARVIEDGVDMGRFWTGSKIFPREAAFTADDELHLDLILAAANLFLFAFGVSPVRNRDAIREVVSQLTPPELVLSKADVEDSSASAEDEMKDQDDEDDEEEQLAELKKTVQALSVADLTQLQPAEFEKDDDTNFHIDFITACANLRAWNYKIEQASRHKAQMIAGKIIPALATTTAMITGLVGIEFFKLALGYTDIEVFRNAYCNLGVEQLLNLSEPVPPKQHKSTEYDPIMLTRTVALPEGWTSWDKIVVDEGKPLTVREFIAVLKKQHFNIDVRMVFKFGMTDDEGKPMYNDNPGLRGEARELMKARLDVDVFEAYKQCYADLPAGRKYLLLGVDAADEEDNDTDIPPIKYILY